MNDDRTAAETACLHVMGRIVRDPRLAYMLGPGTETYRLLTDVVGDLRGEGGDAYRAMIEQHLETEAVVSRAAYDALERELDEVRNGAPSW